MIAALDRPTSGTVTVAGQRVDNLSETAAARYRRGRVGMIGLPITQYDIGLRPDTSPDAYAAALHQAPGSQFGAGTSGAGGTSRRVFTVLIGLLALVVAVVAGLGVLNTVLLDTRERVHDLGVFKALG